MEKNSIFIIGVVIAIALGIIAIGIYYYESTPIIVDSATLKGRIGTDVISSGPLMLTKSQYKIYENIFYIVDGLKEVDKGTIRFFVPDGREYRSTSYDGSQKSAFNLYFRPGTSMLTGFCVQEEFVGEWTVTFDNKAYPPLKFEIINEHLNGPDHKLDKAC